MWHRIKFVYLYNPVPSLQGPILSSRTVLQDVLDENASHHFAVAQSAAHSSSSNDTDPQGLAVLSEKLHSEEGTNIGLLHFHFKVLVFVLIGHVYKMILEA